VQYQTDPTKNDTDGNGVIDSVDVTLASTAKSFTVVPLLVNLYQGSGATEQHFRDAVALMNQFYAKARIRFVLVGVRTGQTAGDDGTAAAPPATAASTIRTTRARRSRRRAATGGRGFPAARHEGRGLGDRRHLDGRCVAAAGLVAASRSGLRVRAALEPRAHRCDDRPRVRPHLHARAPDGGSAENTPGNIMTPSNGGRDAFVDSTDPAKASPT